MGSRDKLNTLYFHMKKTHRHQTRQGADLQRDVLILKATLFFDQVTNVKSLNDLKNMYFHYHKTFGQ